jgi:hypothetical protein
MKGQFSRRNFMRLLAGGGLALATPNLLAAALDELRGDRVGWARLKTKSPIWMRHAGSDPKLMQFFREKTTLNIDPTWYAADVENLGEMVKYPFLFSQDLRPAQSRTARQNLAEYIRRGGFILVDSCINPGTRDPRAEIFSQRHAELFAELLPETRVLQLNPDHELFRCSFDFPDGPPHTAVEPGWDADPFYAVCIDRRLVGVISTSGLQCGWDGMRNLYGFDVTCMQMLVNIYVYSMMQGA